jgi:hypothetical protein
MYAPTLAIKRAVRPAIGADRTCTRKAIGPAMSGNDDAFIFTRMEEDSTGQWRDVEVCFAW